MFEEVIGHAQFIFDLSFLDNEQVQSLWLFQKLKIGHYKTAQGSKELLTFILEKLIQTDCVALLFLRRGHKLAQINSINAKGEENRPKLRVKTNLKNLR